VAKIAEIPPLVLVPNRIVRRCYLSPMRYVNNKIFTITIRTSKKNSNCMTGIMWVEVF
jgi:hypothetical protein